MSVIPEPAAISAFVVTAEELAKQITDLRSQHLILLTVCKSVNKSQLESFATNIAGLANSMFEEMIHFQDAQVISRLEEALVPRVPLSPRLLKEATMLVQARKALLESGDWLTAAQVSELASLSTGNPSTQPNKWKKLGKIFAIHHNGVDYYPGYGLDPENSFRPNKDLATIIAILSGHKKSWGMAYWFHSANSFLGGKRPQNLLHTRPERVIQAAIDEVKAIAHS
ncbi:hypothetical protein [Hydrogenophaga taeniospiralis]|nr:hypothetical protein [Hydrogenophaga taeniospiralis]UCU93396.1 hypothetical protein KI616_21845 [Hydrogenophaga taeniospiralis]